MVVTLEHILVSIGSSHIWEDNVVPKKKNNNSTQDDDRKRQLKNIVELLRFALTLDDEEIVKSTVESVVEVLEEMIDEPKM